MPVTIILSNGKDRTNKRNIAGRTTASRPSWLHFYFGTWKNCVTGRTSVNIVNSFVLYLNLKGLTGLQVEH